MADGVVQLQQRPPLPSNAHIVLASSSLRPVTRSSLLITIPARHNQNVQQQPPPSLKLAQTAADTITGINAAPPRCTASSSTRRSRPRRSRTHQNNDLPPLQYALPVPTADPVNNNNDAVIPTSGIPVHRRRHNINLHALYDTASKRQQSRRPATRSVPAVNDENKVTATRSTKNAGLARSKVSGQG